MVSPLRGPAAADNNIGRGNLDMEDLRARAPIKGSMDVDVLEIVGLNLG